MPTRLTAALTAALALAVAAPAAAAAPPLLTDPFLQDPGRSSVKVAWVTEWPGARHVVLFGRGVERPDSRALERIATGRGARGGTRVARAQTLKTSRTREDAASQVPGRTYAGVTARPLWRHEATVRGLPSHRRTPYRVMSVDSGGDWTLSDVFTLAPLPRRGQAQQILLTSDHQLMPMTPANLEAVEETVGRLDAVFLAGDLINIPDRASEWFDDARGGAFFPSLQGRADRPLTKNGVTTTYRGGELLQHAPLYAAIGNHEVMGRTAEPTLGAQFNAPVPRAVAERAYRERAHEVNPSGSRAVRERWITDNSFNQDTFLELLTMPGSRAGGEKYWAQTIGDVRLLTLHATNIWRTPNTTANARGKYHEPAFALGDELLQGWGQHIFEPVKRGSEQYAWLKDELRSPEWRRARHRVVMWHHPAHTLGDNVSPPFTDPVRIEEPDGSIRYEYPKADDHLIRDVEPLLEAAGADLVFNGHSHVWNRFTGPTGVHYLETSNVGNTYGAFTPQSGRSRPIPPPPWDAANYTAQGDPFGLQPIVPNVAPFRDAAGQPEPYVQSNDVTVFSILDTGAGEVVSYAYDTRLPGSDAFVIDRLRLR